jgi:hypothetical protein
VAKFVTILSPYTKLPSTYEAMDVEVISFLLTQEGMKYKMPRIPTHGPGLEDTAEPGLFFTIVGYHKVARKQKSGRFRASFYGSKAAQV